MQTPTCPGMVGCAPQSAFQGSRTGKVKAKPRLQLMRLAGSAPATCAAQQAFTFQGSSKRPSEEKNTVTNSSELWGWRSKHVKMSDSGLKGLHTAGNLSFLAPAKAEENPASHGSFQKGLFP